MERCNIPSSPCRNECTVPAGKRMIVQIALRDGPESTKVASLQRVLKTNDHPDCFKALPINAASRYVRQRPEVAGPAAPTAGRRARLLRQICRANELSDTVPF